MVLGQILGQIRTIVVKKVKKQALSISFFFLHILHGEYLLKQKVVDVHIPEWKFKANQPPPPSPIDNVHTQNS